MAEAPTEGAPQQKETSVEGPFLLSDDDDPVPDPEHDKFNLANQLPREELLEALKEQDITGGSSAETQEEHDQNMVRMKFESYWEQKEEKRRKKAENEALHRQEMEALKESVKRAEEVEQNVSRSITGLAQSVQDSIQENNRTMMQAISQMLHDVGFAPALQSSYTQGEYPLALGFKPPPDISAKCLPAPAIQFTLPATIPGVPTPALGRTEENQSEEHPGKAAVNDREQTPPTRVQGGGTRDKFGRSKQNDESEASEASSSSPPVRPGDLCSDRAKNIVPAPARTGNTERGRSEIPPQGCSEVVPPLRTLSPPDDDGDTPSMFRTMQRTRGSTGTSASIPSAGAGDIGK
jgi:hypothetical protein